ncbi:MAG: hypothetical protein WC858_02570 [Parcubacteria group bacterium]|jgi:predicted kinase
MKTILIVVIGSPGSGKSYYMKNKLEPLGFYAFDDIFAEAVDNIGDMKHSKFKDELIKRLGNRENCVIADVRFSQKNKQEDLKDFVKIYFSNSVEIQWHCFENNPDICIKNVKKRNIEKSKKQIELINELSMNYIIPANAKIMKTIDVSIANVYK